MIVNSRVRSPLEADFREFCTRFLATRVAQGVVEEQDFVAAATSRFGESAVYGQIFTDFLADFVLLQLRQRWGAADSVRENGRLRLRGLIPVDQFQAREVAPPSPKLLARARAYFDREDV